jgi:hypothetical protein
MDKLWLVAKVGGWKAAVFFLVKFGIEYKDDA